MRNISYIFSSLEKVKKVLQNKPVCLFLDYDGTLSPIAGVPDQAVISSKTRDILFKLSRIPNCRIAIISGRSLKDISQKVGLKNIVYAGNHGFEITGPKIKFKNHVSPKYRRVLKKIKIELKKCLSPIKGVFVEDKGACLAIHYRLADKNDIPTILSSFYSSTFVSELRNDISIRTGKMALEIRPPIAWDKGKAVMWLMGQKPFTTRNRVKCVLPIYIGDDLTDEDAFESLGTKGLTIFVGKPKNTKARFYLKNTIETTKFLAMLLEMLNKKET